MLFPEEDAAQLKTWIVKRIENTSDADSDVLAEYVIALLKHDDNQASVRKLCEEEIPDFLTEDPKTFLDDVFQAIAHKSYMSSAPPDPKPSSATETDKSPVNLPPKPTSSKKRGFDDSGEAHDSSDHQGHGERAYKQLRRGGHRNDGFTGYIPPMDMNGMPHFGNPIPPTNTMEVMMAMQAMGLSLPNMSDFAGYGQGRRQRKRRRCRDFDNKGFCSRGSACVYDHSQEPEAPGAFSIGNAFMDMDMVDMAQFMPHGPQFTSEPPRNGRGNRGGKKNRGGKSSRGGKAAFSADGPVNDRSKSTIVVENIPKESFSEDQIRNFFTQFGTVQEVSMQPYKNLAIIKYSSWDEASAAYRSPQVIFNNRFVKVFWYKDEMETPNQRGPRPGMKGSREEHDGGQDFGQTQELDPDEFQRRQEEAQRLHQEKESKRSELEAKRQELGKQQQELFAKHRAETEKLQAKLRATSSGASAESDNSVDILRAKVALLEQEAKILGIDPEKAHAEDHGGEGGFRGGSGGRGYRGRGAYARGGYAPRGRGSFRGNGARHAAYAQFSIDNRPKKVAISGVDLTPTEKDEALRQFLISNGEFESVKTGAEKTTVSFPDRKTAEKFFFSLQGKELPGVSGTLELSWVNTPLPLVPVGGGPTSSSTDPSANEKAVAEPADEDFVQMGGAGQDSTGTGPARQEEPRREVNMDYEMPDEEAW